ncbi:MAG: hypothetical protein ACXWDE_12570 [Aeromicrobium sp.]
MGLDVELEHGSRDPETDVSGNDPIVTIAVRATSSSGWISKSN